MASSRVMRALAMRRDREDEMHGNTLVSTLRRIYGQSFATDHGGHERLSDVLHKLDEPSLSKLLRDHENLALGTKISKAS
jgi:hypothetical protein